MYGTQRTQCGKTKQSISLIQIILTWNIKDTLIEQVIKLRLEPQYIISKLTLIHAYLVFQVSSS